ncbi:hypothetical protein [Mangrovicoccus algicola]|uniref:Uncharacterized protein n=1 Tax=Mangrovicoccus algicola TaxID=2771008 RepID=A0A8J6YW80_9RHOB|nr:hypothetical protein [Mangrovicoccus algicola]MBE3637369.1 hypothetical protein [Mangrovicoccus algicola]
MADGSGYDNTNSGIVFKPHDDQILSGSGKLNINGQETRVVMLFEQVSRDGKRELVLYQRVGPLFPNDRQDNEKAPQFSGPCDGPLSHMRIAAWKRSKDGRDFLSLKISERQQQGGGGGGGGQQGGNGWGGNQQGPQGGGYGNQQGGGYGGGTAHGGQQNHGGQQGYGNQRGGGGGYSDDEIPF